MKIEQYLLHAESCRVRRATIIILLIDALLVGLLGVFCYYTFTQFGRTTLTQGVADFVTWIGGAK